MKGKKYYYWIIALAFLLILAACGSSAGESVEKSNSASTSAESLDRYPDKKEIGSVYREAVLHMTEQGVLQGYDDGNFYPAVTLTREQGAKIITYLLLDSAQAEALICEAAPYKDVAADRWSAACISWCTEHHILDGYGDGNYGPEDSLTGRQFAKMLLCAYELGDPSRYLGDSWKEHVSTDASGAGLFAGDESMDSDVPLQRQQAALMADNAKISAEKTETADPEDSSGSSAGSDGSSSEGSDPGDIETPDIDITSENSTESGSGTDSDAVTDSDSTGNPDSAGSNVGSDDQNSTGNPDNSSPDNSNQGEEVTVNENGDILLPEVP